MEIAICDDNRIMAAQVEEFLVDTPFQDLQCEVFYSGNALLAHLEKGYTYPIYFLDIEMEGSNGIETALRIRRDDSKALIVFMTEYQEYVYQVFEALPFRFLSKPLIKEKVQKVLAECIEQIRINGLFFFFKIERRKYQVSYEEILYFEGRGRKVGLRTTGEEYEFYGKISSVEKELDRSLFCRIHISYLVNMDAIRVVSEREVELSNGNKLPISRSYRDCVRQKHLEYMALKSGV